MLTNLIHLNRFQFYSHGQFSADPATWFVFLILITGVATGCGFGLLSLVMLQRHIKQRHGAIWGCLLITTVSLSSGIAIWIGRILRFNSWDIVFRPFYLIRSIIAQFDLDAFLLCILFAIMSAGMYLLFRVFLNGVDEMKRICPLLIIVVVTLGLSGCFGYKFGYKEEITVFTDSTGVQWRVLAEDGKGNQLIITEHVHGLVQYNSSNLYTFLGQSDGLRIALNAWFIDTLAPELRENALPAGNVDNDVRLTSGGGTEVFHGVTAHENEAAGWTVAATGTASPENSLFVLSISEANKYSNLGTLNVQGMVRVIPEGHFVPAAWWLRSPGGSSDSPVTLMWACDSVGAFVSVASATSKYGFRPALWISR